MQWLAFIPAAIAQTERYYDLTGSLTYVSLAVLAMGVKGDPRSLLLGAMVTLWAVRLGSFLFARISAAGKDRRFDRIKTQPMAFFLTWNLQGLWVVMTSAAALAAMTSIAQVPLSLLALLGTTLWVIGFVIETVADRQKQRFRLDPLNDHAFITTGLWAWSRHPNYLGEILLWTGVAIVALPALDGWQHVALISPLFVYWLLTRISGIPLLEAQAEKRWGETAAYRDYVAQTPLLWPRPPRPKGH
jgi:steroid 5-alpha reductase family enzyme